MEMVLGLSDGLKALVEERGQMMSGGERQRVAIARAILRQPMLLILDEATSAPDMISERRMLRALRHRLPATTVPLIRHRDHALEARDRILDFDRSRPAADVRHQTPAPRAAAK